MNETAEPCSLSAQSQAAGQPRRLSQRGLVRSDGSNPRSQVIAIPHSLSWLVPGHEGHTTRWTAKSKAVIVRPLGRDCMEGMH